MARPNRIHFPGALYHVLARGNQRQKVFRDDVDYRKYRERLFHYRKHFSFFLHAYVFMPNHVHLLLEAGSVPLSRVMQGLQFTYAQYFNKKYRMVGHLFQGRYKAILCEKEAYLLELVRYIHLNPVRAKLVDLPEHYRWSSYPVYLGSRDEPAVSTEFVLNQFGERLSFARKGFRKFVMGTIEEGSRQDLYELKAQTCLGSDEFVEKVPVRSYPERKLYRVPLAEITKVVCESLGVKEGDLKSRSRTRKPAEARHLIGYLAKELVGLSHVKVARTFGRETIGFSAGVRKIASRVNEKRSFRKRVDELAGRLIQEKKGYINIFA